MRIEIGSYYVDRRGEVRGPLIAAPDSNTLYQFATLQDAAGFYASFTADGTFYADRTDIYDLVRPATPQEIAAHHKTRLVDNSAASIGKRYEDECKVTKQQAEMIAERDRYSASMNEALSARDSQIRDLEAKLRANSAAVPFAKRFANIALHADIAARDKEIEKLRAQLAASLLEQTDLRHTVRRVQNEHAGLSEANFQLRKRDEKLAGYEKTISTLTRHLETSREWRARRAAIIRKQGEIIRELRAGNGTEGQARTIAELHARFENQRQTIIDMQAERAESRDRLARTQNELYAVKTRAQAARDALEA